MKISSKKLGAFTSKAIDNLDNIGWGRSGAAAGAIFGGAVGAMSDRQNTLGGATKGAVAGLGMAKLARFASSLGARSAKQMDTYKAKSAFAPGGLLHGADKATKDALKDKAGIDATNASTVISSVASHFPDVATGTGASATKQAAKQAAKGTKATAQSNTP